MGINGNQLVLVFQVDVDISSAVSDGEFRSPAQLDGPQHGATLGIDHGGGVGVSLLAKYPLRGRVVNYGVGVVVGLRLTDHLEGLQLENNYFSLGTVGDESPAQLARDGHSMILFQARDVADQAAIIGVDDFNLRATRQVNAPRRRVHRNIVEILPRTPFGCTERVFRQHVITARSGYDQSK